jgi:hypothetical protein
MTAATETRATRAERKLIRAVEVHERNLAAAKASYDVMFNNIKEASEDGSSYDRIREITKLSKTQIGRILRA